MGVRDFNALNDLWKFNGTNWTWISGSKTALASGSYNTSPVSTNTPGARYRQLMLIDSSDNIRLFGGFGRISTWGVLNDLWNFDGTYWIWISGSSSYDPAGVYGLIGVADPGNSPGGREGSGGWIDSSGNIYIFGGYGIDKNNTAGWLNDMWKYDGADWTWLNGSDVKEASGEYISRLTENEFNFPEQDQVFCLFMTVLNISGFSEVQF